MFQRASHALSAGDYAEARRLADAALAAGRKSHGVNAEVAYAGVWFRLALDLGTLAGDGGRERADVRRQPAPADVADRRRPRPRRRRPPRRRPGPLRGPRRCSTACSCATTRCSCPARARWPRWRWRSTTPSGRPSCADRSSRTPTRIATSGLAGISIGPVSHYVGLAAEAAGDLDGRRRRSSGRPSTATVRDGTRPPRGPGPPALGRVLRGPGDAEARPPRSRRRRRRSADRDRPRARRMSERVFERATEALRQRPRARRRSVTSTKSRSWAATSSNHRTASSGSPARS